MLFNSVTQELYPRQNNLLVVPVYFRTAYVEWTPREKGGGIVATHEKTAEGERLYKSATRNAQNKDILSNGNLIVDTHYHYVLVFDKETGVIYPALISMSATQLKKSRKWNSTKNSFHVQTPQGKRTEPSFGRWYTATTTVESNEHGSWYTWELGHAGRVSRDVFEEAVAFYEAVKKGAVKTADEAAANGEPRTGAGRRADAGLDDEIPM